jgi:hypothetical protein
MPLNQGHTDAFLLRPFDVKPHGFADTDALPPDDEKFYFILLITSLPFPILGISLTLRVLLLRR